MQVHYNVNQNKRRVFVAVLLVVLTIVAVVGIAELNRQPKILPDPLAKQITFVVYVPSQPWKVTSNSFRYNPQTGVLTITATQLEEHIIITEQATPSQFNDIPQFYPTLLNKLNQYQSIGTVSGNVNLVHPTELKGKQQAVLNNNGTLVFVNPSKDLTADEWRKLFNNMQLVR